MECLKKAEDRHKLFTTTSDDEELEITSQQGDLSFDSIDGN